MQLRGMYRPQINYAPLDGGGGGQVDPRVAVQNNMLARQACIRQGVNMWQQIFTKTYTSGIPGTVENVPLRNVGLAKRLLVQITATVQANGQTLSRCPFGPAQIFSAVVTSDLSNQTRINTPGWHLHAIASAKRRRVFGASYLSDTPTGYGSNYPQVMAAPSIITTNPVTNNVFMEYEIPFAYSDNDLRGAYYLNVTNATAYLQYTVNPNFFIASGSDPTLGVYQSSSATAGVITSLTVTVYQNYLDQLPLSPVGPVLPLLDLSTSYMLQNTSIIANTSNQDIPIPYANFRDFLSTCIILDNGGVLNAGSDVNYWALQSANYTNIFKYGPQIAALMARDLLQDDPPAGMYYFSSREKPISTIQYGNMQMIGNLINASATANFLMGFEMMALINQITQAGSLYGN